MLAVIPQEAHTHVGRVEHFFVQTFVDAPHGASGAIPRDVKPYFEGPYFEWFTAEAVVGARGWWAGWC